MKWLIIIGLIWLASQNPKFLDSSRPGQANTEGFFPGAEDE